MRGHPLVAGMLAVLTQASSTTAEYAWIAGQWSVGFDDDYPIFNRSKERIAASRTQAECLTTLRGRARTIPMAKEKGSKVTDQMVGAADVQRANGSITSFECWRDTVDPREPKPSAR